MNDKPLIGLSCSFDDRSDMGTGKDVVTHGQSVHYVPGDYINAVLRAGGIPVIIPLFEKKEDLTELLARLDGILMTGGCDVDPSFYGEEKSVLCGRTSPERDVQEIAAVRYAVENDVPILGICRGIQIMNVALGGTLWQDLQSEGGFENHRCSVPRNEIRHYVILKEGSVLSEIYGKTRLGVNSFHHQSVRGVCEGAGAVAQSEDGVIEAIELSDRKFALAVQWHPEMLYDSAEQGKLLRYFVSKCAE